MIRNPLCCRSATMRTPGFPECSSLRAHDRADFISLLMDRILSCTGNGRALIFDSAILDFVITTEREIHPLTPRGYSVINFRRNLKGKISQRKLNCALYVRAPKQFGVALLKAIWDWAISLIKTFFQRPSVRLRPSGLRRDKGSRKSYFYKIGRT